MPALEVPDDPPELPLDKCEDPPLLVPEEPAFEEPALEVPALEVPNDPPLDPPSLLGPPLLADVEGPAEAPPDELDCGGGGPEHWATGSPTSPEPAFASASVAAASSASA